MTISDLNNLTDEELGKNTILTVIKIYRTVKKQIYGEKGISIFSGFVCET
jgi:hypothetical protein